MGVLRTVICGKFFKATFSDLEVAKDFLTYFVPQPIIELIDLTSLKLEKDSFVSHKLDENFTDLLFKTKIKDHPAYLHFLFEHKSYLSKNVSLQLLRYMLEIWSASQKEKPSDDLPMVIPIVIYHGDPIWTIPLKLGDLINGYDDLPVDVQKYAPDFEYVLYNVIDYQDTNFKVHVFLRIMFNLFRDIRKKGPKAILKTIFHAVDLLKQFTNQDTALQYLETMMYYVFHANQQVTNDKFHDIMGYIEQNYSEGSDRVMTLAEIFREEGKLEGQLELQIKNAIQLITKFVAPVPDQLEERINQQDLATLDTIIMSIDEWKSLEEIEKILK
ncbi:MAG TPA: Rpn family recombination-promoting nuclease/putative transposase [Bacilli bacterium]|nr:Rpn family recombination-promoting nuclease/putative transposase [Bacilli bacterium]